MSASNELGQWYRSIPKMTRTWLTGSVAVSLLARLGLVHPYNLVLLVGPTFKHLQVYLLENIHWKILDLF